MSHTKIIFVTIGATAAFEALIQAVVQPSFLRALKEASYTRLIIQYGAGGKELFEKLVKEAQEQGSYGLTVEGFEFTQNMMRDMSVAKAELGREEGVVLCHAGTGSVLDALRIGVPVIVVPNPTLLDNHQVEFAEVMARMGYAVHGELEYDHSPYVRYSRWGGFLKANSNDSNLSEALTQSETLRKKSKEWPPVNSGTQRRGNGLAGVIDEELGFLD